MWLVDGAYMLNASRSVGPGYRLDYVRLRELLERGGPFTQAYYVDSVPHPTGDAQDHFHSRLKLAPPAGPHFIVRLYPLKEVDVDCPHCRQPSTRFAQKGVDVAIATLALHLAYRDQYDTLVLSTGDGDLEDAVAHVRNALHKRVELAVFRQGASPDLQAYADEVTWLDDHAAEFELKRYAGACTACGRPTELPFVPDGVRPVYCRECHLQARTRKDAARAPPA